MIEEEAKTKWCPFARVVIADATVQTAAHNRFNVQAKDGDDWQYSLNPPITHCIGSGCMAWRWRTVPNPDWKPEIQMAVYPQPNAYSRPPQGIPSTSEGGCGLAGSPQ